MDLLSFFAHPVVVWLLAAVLVAITVAIAWCWRSIAMPAVARLQDATETIERVHGRAAYEQHYQRLAGDIATQLRSVPSWSRAWTDYQSTLQIMDRGDGVKVVAGEHDPADFFSVTLMDRDHSMHWFRSLPNYLVGLGLCFTFLGIIIVIYQAANSLGADADSTIGALRQLLYAASLKFVTSFTGVSCSIGFSIYFRVHCARIERALDVFCSVLRNRILVLNPSTLLQIDLQQSRRQTTLLGSLASNIAMGLGEKMNEIAEQDRRALDRLEKKLEEAIEQGRENTSTTVAAIRELRERVGQINEETMGRLVDATLKSLDSALQSSLRHISKTLEGVGDRMEGTQRHFEEINRSVAQLKAGYHEIGEEVRTRAEEVSDLLINAENQIEIHLKGAATAAASVENTFISIFSDAEGLEKLSSGIAITAHELGAATSGWSALNRDLSGAAGTLVGASTATQSAAEALEETWQAQVSRLDGIDSHLGITIAAVQTHFDAYGIRMREFTSEFEKTMTNTLDAFGVTIQSLGDAPERLGAAAEGMKQVAEDASKALAPLLDLRLLADVMKASVKALSLAVSQADCAPVVEEPAVEEPVTS